MTPVTAAPAGAACSLLEVRAYPGPSLHCDFPCVAGLVVLGEGDRPDPLRLAGRLREVLDPFGANAGAGADEDVGAAADGAALAGDDPATGVARCIAALAGYLERTAGGRGYPAFGRPAAADRALAVFACDVRASGLEVLRFAASIVERLLGPMPAAPDGLRAEIARFVPAVEALHLDPYAASLVEAAARRGIPAYRLAATGRFVQLGQGCRQRHFLETTSDAGSPVGVKLAANKPAALELLAALGLPVPEGGVAGSAEEARRLADRLGYPVVVKPTHGMSGKGVGVGLRTGEEVEAAGRAALAMHLGVLRVERHVAGQDHRLLVVGGRLVSVVRRTPAHVIGDGVQTVDELLLALNRSRRADPRGLLQPVARDADADRQLARQGLDFASVPATGRVVFLRGAANIAVGGSAHELTDRVHPDLRRMAETAARAFHLDIAGLDYIGEDVAAPPLESGGAFCEINPFPGLRVHWLAGGRDGRIENALLDLHFPNGADGRIPVALITGSSGKTTTARMLARILESAGRRPGLACTDGLFAGGAVLRQGDCAGGRPARHLLLQPEIDVAVMELGRGGLLRSGVPVDACDVAAVLAVHGDHLGQDGVETLEALAAIKALPLRTARQRVVLNADDPRCLAMAAALRPLPVCWITAREARPPAMAADDWLVALAGEGEAMRILRRAPRPAELCRASRIPAFRDGILPANAFNAAAAAAIALALGVPEEAIGAGLSGFRGDFADNPGRYNLWRGPRGAVLLDRADSPDDMRSLAEAALRIPAPAGRTLVVTAPGNRTDAHIEAIGAAAAGAFDRAIAYSWSDRRGRGGDEVPALLRDGLAAGGMPGDRIACRSDQAAALGEGLAGLSADGLLVIVCLEAGQPLEALRESIEAAVGV